MKIKLNPMEAMDLLQTVKEVEVRASYSVYPGLSKSIRGKPEMFYDNAEGDSDFRAEMEKYTVNEIYITSKNEVILYCEYHT